MLKWCVVGSGDVVNRLVANSLNIKNKSKVISIVSNDQKQGELLAKKIKAESFYLKTKSKQEYIGSHYISLNILINFQVTKSSMLLKKLAEK